MMQDRLSQARCAGSKRAPAALLHRRVPYLHSRKTCNRTRAICGGEQSICPAAATGVPRRHALLLLPSAAALLQLTAAGCLALPQPAKAAEGGVVPTPEVAAAINKAIDKAMNKGKAPTALRLVYHDAGTFSKLPGDGGLNASIQFELDRPENFGLKKGWKIIEQAKANLKGTPAEGLVSSSDLIAWAGARAVAITGGPVIAPLTIGRVDATSADPPGRMASENSDARVLAENFAAKGFSVREMVALSGAHTLGNKGFGNPTGFDTAYYTTLLAKPWLDPKNEMATHIGLPSDHALPEDPECLPIIREYARDEAAFRRDFAQAYRKLVATGVAWRAV